MCDGRMLQPAVPGAFHHRGFGAAQGGGVRGRCGDGCRLKPLPQGPHGVARIALGVVPVLRLNARRNSRASRNTTLAPTWAIGSLLPSRSSRARSLDRKSVVEGKRVTVHVDLGGRRTIKQKNQT